MLDEIWYLKKFNIFYYPTHVYVYLFLMQSACSQDFWDIWKGFNYIGLILVGLIAWLWCD